MKNKEVLRLISIMLQYPEEEWTNASLSEEIKGIANEQVFKKMKQFGEYIEGASIEELRENYVKTFDFDEKTNLYLTYAKMKDDRERGQILVELKGFYENEGLIMRDDELPDYLPLFLEFVSVADGEIVTKLVGTLKAPIQILKEELNNINSPYAHLIDASLLILDELYDK